MPGTDEVKRDAARPILPSNGERNRPLILFHMAHAGFFRNFEATIQSVMLAGIDVHVRLSKKHLYISMDDYLLPSAADVEALSFSVGELLNSESSKRNQRLRIQRNILHYLKPHLRVAENLQVRFDEMQKKDVMSLRELQFWRKCFRYCPGFVAATIDRLLAWIDLRTPAESKALDLLDRLSPALVVVTPMVDFASKELEIVKAAKKRHIPTVLAVASWDNLTNKGRVQMQPDYVAVWNRAMSEEAERYHELKKESIWITGAPPFDRWFDMQPSQTRKEFLKSLGLEHARKTVLYLCSSESIGGGREHSVLYEWLRALKKSPHPRWKVLKDINVLVRPHPMATTWLKRLKSDAYPGGVYFGARVWPIDCKHPTSGHGAELFFDSLCHADAVVGLNTSAMIEAAILGKPVLTIENHEASSTQCGNLHYRHLAESGFLHRASDFEEHTAQLIEVLENPSRSVQAAEHFIQSFVRPFGRDQSASQRLAGLLVDAVLSGELKDNHRERIQ